VKRFNRTLQEKMFRYFTYKNTRRYTEILQDLLHSYNNTYHLSIGVSPLEVNRDNEDAVRDRPYPMKRKHFKWKNEFGDRVRMAKQRRPFHKAYLGHWTEEIRLFSQIRIVKNLAGFEKKCCYLTKCLN